MHWKWFTVFLPKYNDNFSIANANFNRQGFIIHNFVAYGSRVFACIFLGNITYELLLREALKSAMLKKKLNRLSFSQTPSPPGQKLNRLCRNTIFFYLFFFNINVTSCPYIYPSIYVYLRISNGC